MSKHPAVTISRSLYSVAPVITPLLVGVVSKVYDSTNRTLREIEPPKVTLPRKPPPGVEVAPRVHPGLKPAPDMPVVRFALQGFRITGATIFPEPELQQVLREYVGQEVGFKELGEATARLTRFYKERGYSLATAYLPAQDIKDGVVELAVLEVRYGNVRLLNRSRVRDEQISAYLEDLPGRVVEDANLERKLRLIYDLPGVKPAKAVLHPGEATGETDLRVELEGSSTATGGIELDNYGNKYTGTTRYSGVLDVFSGLGLGDRLSVRATKGEPGLEFIRLGYQLPLGGDGLQVGAGYSHTHYRLGREFAPLEANGDADTWLVFASYPLVRRRTFRSKRRCRSPSTMPRRAPTAHSRNGT